MNINPLDSLIISIISNPQADRLTGGFEHPPVLYDSQTIPDDPLLASFGQNLYFLGFKCRVKETPGLKTVECTMCGV